MTFLMQLSDLHLVQSGKLLYGTVDATARLDEALTIIRNAALTPDAILVTGDVGDHGNADAYRAARSRVEAYGDEVNAPVIWVNGNHDETLSFRKHILDGAATDRVHDIDGARVVVLDSTVPNANHGHLDGDQLRWLRTQLADAQHQPTIIALHHPPVRSPLTNLDRDMLRNRDELADVLRGSGVALVVAGHTHYSGAGSCGGVPVWISGSTAAYSDVAPPLQRGRCAEYSTYSRIDIIDSEAVATAVPLQPMRTVLDFQAIIDGTIDPAELAEIGIRPQRRT